MRDILSAIRDRVVVFDGSMGATLEQYDLSLEDDYKLEGRCHEALVLNRPDVIGELHALMIEAGADVVETDTFQASRLKLEEWGLGEHTLRDQPARPPRSRARRSARTTSSPARSARPATCPASDDPTLGQITFRELVEVFEEQGRGLIEGGADLIIIETAQDILEVKAADVRRARGDEGRRAHASRSRPRSRCCPTAARCCWAPTSRAVLATLEALKVDIIGLNCSTGPEDMRDAVRFLGEYCPMPVHCIPNAGLPLQGPNGETIFPEEPEPLANTLGEFVDRYGVNVVGGCCGTTVEHISAIAERVKGKPSPPSVPRRAPPHVSSDDRRDAARAGSRADDRRRARQLAGLAQGQGAAARRRLRRHRPGRRGPGRGRRARARPLRRADRARRRGRADADGRQEGLADPADADPDRLDRARRDRQGARPDPGPRDRQLRQPRGRPRQARHGRPARRRARRRADRADDRRGRHGQDARAQARDRPAHHRDGLRRARPGARAADLRPADLHAHDRRRGVAPVRDRDDRGHPPGQEGAARRADVARRLQRVVRHRPARARGPELGLPAPLRRGRPGPRDGQPEPHHALQRDLGGGARARRRPRVRPLRGRAAEVHRALRVQGTRARRPSRPTRPPA